MSTHRRLFLLLLLVTGTDYGTGNLTGKCSCNGCVTGNYTGNCTGTVTGNLTGNWTGTGIVTGNCIHTFTGNVHANCTGIVTVTFTVNATVTIIGNYSREKSQLSALWPIYQNICKYVRHEDMNSKIKAALYSNKLFSIAEIIVWMFPTGDIRETWLFM